MSIGNVIEKGKFVHIYDEKNRQIGSIPLGSGPKDGLKGYTSKTVNIQKGSFIHTHDEKGKFISSRPI